MPSRKIHWFLVYSCKVLIDHSNALSQDTLVSCMVMIDHSNALSQDTLVSCMVMIDHSIVMPSRKIHWSLVW